MQLFVLLIAKHTNIQAADFVSPVTLSLIGMRSDNLTLTATAALVSPKVVPMEAAVLLKLLIFSLCSIVIVSVTTTSTAGILTSRPP